jgi:hypothetical protein
MAMIVVRAWTLAWFACFLAGGTAGLYLVLDHPSIVPGAWLRILVVVTASVGMGFLAADYAALFAGTGDEEGA